MHTTGKVRLWKIRLDSSGYENYKIGGIPGFRYWGIPNNLYRFQFQDEQEWEHLNYPMEVRASNREDAKKEILKRFSNAKFYR